MTDVRVPASGNIIVRWHAANAFANPAKPTPAEVNAGLNLGDAISWNDFSFGVSASNTINDPAITARSNVADRGAAQYGGNLSFYYPRDKADMGNHLAVVRSALRTPRTIGYISVQIDGEASENNTPSYAGGLTQTAAAGDLIHIFKVMTSSYSEEITGEEAFRYTVGFAPQGEMYVNAVVASTLTVAVTPSTATPSVGSITPLKATVNGREFTRGVRWSTSDASKATVSQNGVVTAIAAGTATITATYAGSTASASLTIS